MLARYSFLVEKLPSLSRATIVSANNASNALVSLTSNAWFHAVSRANTRPLLHVV